MTDKEKRMESICGDIRDQAMLAVYGFGNISNWAQSRDKRVDKIIELAETLKTLRDSN